MQLQGGKFTACNTAGTGDNQQGRQIADEHSQNMLQTQGDCLGQRHFSIQLEGFFRQSVCLLHIETSFFLKF